MNPNPNQGPAPRGDAGRGPGALFAACLGVALAALAGPAQALPLADLSLARPWAQGTAVDKAGSAVAFRSVAGPDGPAVELKAHTVLWGGFWIKATRDLTPRSDVAFRARADHPALWTVQLTDAAKVRVEHIIRLAGGGWERFSLPLASFRRSDTQDPSVPADLAFDPSHLASLWFGSAEPGSGTLTLADLEELPGGRRLRDGLPGPGVIQDFVALGGQDFGTYQDARGSRLQASVVDRAPGRDRAALAVDYSQVASGWCGAWMRAGCDWKGQDWRGAKALVARLYAQDAVEVQAAFNDAQSNAYVSAPRSVPAKTWTDVEFPVAAFGLNPYYQPKGAHPGRPLDLSNIESVSLSFLTPGAHQIWIGEWRLER